MEKQPKIDYLSPVFRAVVNFNLTILLFLSAGQAFSTEKSQACIAELRELMTCNFDNLYRRGDCLHNSGELARLALKRLSTPPEPTDLTILLIKNKQHKLPRSGWYLDTPPPELLLYPSALKDKPEKVTWWHYHALLQFKGRVFDFDANSLLQGSPTNEYFPSALPPKFVPAETPNQTTLEVRNNWDDLVVFEIRLSDYIFMLPHHRPSIVDIHMFTENAKKPTPLWEFLTRAAD